MICDLAEVYHIYDYKSVPTKLLATLVAGLGQNSRVSMAMAGATASADTILLAKILDGLNLLLWSYTEDGRKNRNRPDQLAPKFFQSEENRKKEIQRFDTPEDFHATWERLTKGAING